MQSWKSLEIFAYSEVDKVQVKSSGLLWQTIHIQVYGGMK